MSGGGLAVRSGGAGGCAGVVREWTNAVMLLYLSADLGSGDQMPFDGGPRAQKWVVAHLGECASKSCAAPWHVDVVPHMLNTMTGQWMRHHRGIHSGSWQYGKQSPNYEESNDKVGVTGTGGAGGVGGVGVGGAAVWGRQFM